MLSRHLDPVDERDDAGCQSPVECVSSLSQRLAWRDIHQPNQEHGRDAQPPSQRQLQAPDCRKRQENEIQVTENADHPHGDTQGEAAVAFRRSQLVLIILLGRAVGWGAHGRIGDHGSKVEEAGGDGAADGKEFEPAEGVKDLDEDNEEGKLDEPDKRPVQGFEDECQL